MNINIGLGTAQFGGRYGIRSKSISEANKKILLNSYVNSQTLPLIDTSHEYGSALEFIGANAHITRHAKICYKFRHMTRRQILDDFDKMEKTKIYCAMFHEGESIASHRELYDTLQRLKYQGRIEKIGASFYDPDSLRSLISQNIVPDILQFPVNFFDHRFVGPCNSELCNDLKKKGVEIHGRSLFLQGVILQDPQRLPTYFDQFRTHLGRCANVWINRTLNPVYACLDYAAKMKIDYVIIGFENALQLQDVVRWQRERPIKELSYKQFKSPSVGLIDPRKWVL